MDLENDKDFTVNLMFPDEYRDFIAEICYKSEYVCIINQELGPSVFSIEFGHPSVQPPLDGFLRTIDYAQRRLFELRRQE